MLGVTLGMEMGPIGGQVPDRATQEQPISHGWARQVAGHQCRLLQGVAGPRVGTMRAAVASDTMMPMPRSVLLLLVLAIAAGACAAPSDDRVVQESFDVRFDQVALDDVQIWRSAEGNSDSLEADVTGALGYEDECGAFLHSAEADLRYPVVWPAGTDIHQADPLIVRLPDDVTVEVGELVSGAGEWGETAIFNASATVEVIAAAPEPSEPTTAAPVALDRCVDLEEPPPEPDGSLRVEVTFSEAELDAAQAILDPVVQQQFEGREGGDLRPGDVLSMSVDAPTNRLQLGTYTDDDEAMRWVAELVDPALLCVEVQEIPGVGDAGPARAPSADADL